MFQPLQDWIVVELEPAAAQSKGGIILVGPQPVRTARVVAVGPGRVTKSGVRVAPQVKVGDRFPFFKAVTDTRQGRALAECLPDNQELIRETDVLFVLGDGETPEVSL